MCKRTNAFSLAIVSLLILTLTPSTLLKGVEHEPLNAPGHTETPERSLNASSALSAQSAVQAEPENVEFVGQIAGSIYPVAVRETSAYVGLGPRLVVLDMSDSASPTVRGQSDVLDGVVSGVTVAGDYAYVADGFGLHVVDISDPANPTQTGSLETPESAYDVEVAGTYAYVADAGVDEFASTAGVLRVVDVSDPANPTQAGSLETPGAAVGVTVGGDYAYIADGFAGLQIVDISTPSDPAPVASYESPAYTQQVAVMGSYAYIADSWPDQGLHTVDISDPANPTRVSLHETPGFARDVAVADGYAYIADADGGLRIVDISVPYDPREAGSCDTPGPASAVAVAQGYAYVADGNSLGIVNVSDPTNPISTGSHDTSGFARDVTVAEGHAYAAANPGLRVANVSDLRNPVEVGSYETPGFTYGVAVEANHAYVAGGTEGLHIVDVSDPTNVTGAGFHDTAGSAGDIALKDSYAYVADGGAGLQIVNVSDPINPVSIGSHDTPGFARDVALKDSYAYVADGGAGLQIVDVSNPSNPSGVGSLGTPGNAWGVAVEANHAYVADGAEGLRIIDVSDPTDPIEVGAYDTPGTAMAVSVARNRAYIADATGGLRIVDVCDLTHPTETGSYDTPGSAQGVTVAAEYTYVADGDGGVLILRYTGPEICIRHIEVTQAIQDEDNSVTLIAGKPTFGRVYVDCGAGCGSVSNVTGILRGHGLDGELDESPLSPVNLRITAYDSPDWRTQRADLEKTLNYTLPPTWATGIVTFTADVAGTQHSEVVVFQKAGAMNTLYVPIRDGDNEPDSSAIADAWHFARRLFPTSELNYIPMPSWEWHRSWRCRWKFPPSLYPDEYHQCLKEDLKNRLTELYWDQTVGGYIFGWLPETTDIGVEGSSDPTWNGGRGKAAFGLCTIEKGIEDGFHHRERIFAHEIGHLLGARHTNADDCTDEDPDPYWPDSTTARIRNYGVDGSGFGWLASSPNAVKEPDDTYDYMSYCGHLDTGTVWTSAWTYDHIYSETLRSEVFAEQSRTSLANQPYLLTSGLVFTDHTGILDTAWVFTPTLPPQDLPAGTQYCLEAQDVSATALVSRCFDLDFYSYETGEASAVDGFNVTLPYSSSVARLALKKGEQELVTRTVTPNAPVVSVLSPNGGETWPATGRYTITWMANDTDGDALTYRVAYSPDGNDWVPVGSAITKTHLAVNAAELAGGNNARIRVMASDGINTSNDESDAPFTVEDKAPTAYILAPEGEGTIRPGTPILLRGYGYDLEDGVLGEDAHHWSSTRDGVLGTGSESLVTLSPGTHLITLTLTDSDGKTGTATLTVFVGNRAYLPVVLRD